MTALHVTRPNSRGAGSKRIGAHVIGLVCLALVAAGCTQTSVLLREGAAPGGSSGKRVLLMPPDVEVSEITAAGLPEPNAAWTDTARRNIDAALDGAMADRKAELVRYAAAAGQDPYDEAHLPAVRLHRAVGRTILLHKGIPNFALPTKKDTFDWSLGETTAVLRDDYGADYALFVYLNDSFASSGRVALIVVAAVFGVGVPGGQQVGFASLVDLRSGDVVWFNRIASGTGDIRKPDLARGAVDNLLHELPL